MDFSSGVIGAPCAGYLLKVKDENNSQKGNYFKAFNDSLTFRIGNKKLDNSRVVLSIGILF